MNDLNDALLLAARKALSAVPPSDRRNLFLAIVYPELVAQLRPAPDGRQRRALCDFANSLLDGNDWTESVAKLAESLKEISR